MIHRHRLEVNQGPSDRRSGSVSLVLCFFDGFLFLFLLFLLSVLRIVFRILRVPHFVVTLAGLALFGACLVMRPEPRITRTVYGTI